MRTGLAIVGSGVSARMHAKALTECADAASLTGFCSTDERSAADFGRTFGAKRFASLEALLEDETTDAVILCTPSGLHARQAQAVLAAGKHVLIEKPAAVTQAQAQALLKAAENSAGKAAVVSQLRLYPDVLKLRDMLASAAFGKVTLVSLHMHYYRSQAYYDSAAWRGTVEMDGGALMNQGIHGLDLLLFLFGSVKRVSAITKTAARRMEAEDTAAALLEFESGALCTVSASSCVKPGHPRTLTVCGTEGSAVLTETRLTMTDESDAPPHLPADYRSFDDPAAVPTAAHALVLRDFCAYLTQNKTPASTLADGCSAAALVWAITQASRTGGFIRPIRYENAAATEKD